MTAWLYFAVYAQMMLRSSVSHSGIDMFSSEWYVIAMRGSVSVQESPANYLEGEKMVGHAQYIVIGSLKAK
jgi:hypothetical protein